MKFKNNLISSDNTHKTIKLVMQHIYIPIEIKARELIPNLKLISEGIKKNIVFYLGSKKSIIRILKNKKLKSGIFFLKPF